VQAVELTFDPALAVDALMLIPRLLIDRRLAQDLLGLSPNWMNEERPLLLARCVLLPMMYAMYTVGLLALSAGNVQGAGLHWLLLSLALSVVCFRESGEAIRQFLSFLLTSGQFESSLSSQIVAWIALLGSSLHSLILILYLILAANTLNAKRLLRRTRLMSPDARQRELQAADGPRERRAYRAARGAWHALRRYVGVAPQQRLPILLLVGCAMALAINTGTCIGLLLVTSRLREQGERLARELDEIGLVFTAALPEMESVLLSHALDVCGSLDAMRFVVRVGLPLAASLVSPLALGVKVGLDFGALLALCGTVAGVAGTVKTYSALYTLFACESPATLRFPIFRPDAVRLVSSIVAYMLIGVMVTCLLCAGCGAWVALLWVQWPLAAALRHALANTVANLLFYLLLLAPICVPLAQRCRSGPVLFGFDMYFLSTNIIKAWFRIVLLVIFSCSPFFSPAQNMFPDGYECWESGHVVFCSYVMECVEQDRQQAKRSTKK